MTPRESLAAKIRGLRAKTVENGCTEDEAISAASKAAEMLAKYNFTLDEVELRASPFQRHTETHVDPVGERLWKPAMAIAELTGATFWTSPRGVHPVQIHFFGFAHEVEVATYMLELCAGAMRREQARLMQGAGLLRPAAQRARMLPFLDGMGDRLRDRIRALKPPPAASSGTGLVVLHGALVKEAMALAGIKTQPGKARSSRDLDAAYAEGLRAGDRVSLARAMGGAKAAALLG